MQHYLLKNELTPQVTPRNVTIWLINYYSIPRSNDLSLYWGLPYFVDNYTAIKHWVERVMSEQPYNGRVLGDLRRRFEEMLPI